MVTGSGLSIWSPKAHPYGILPSTRSQFLQQDHTSSNKILPLNLFKQQHSLFIKPSNIWANIRPFLFNYIHTSMNLCILAQCQELGGVLWHFKTILKHIFNKHFCCASRLLCGILIISGVEEFKCVLCISTFIEYWFCLSVFFTLHDPWKCLHSDKVWIYLIINMFSNILSCGIVTAIC